MSDNDAISRISGIEMPDYYHDYYSNLFLSMRKPQLQNLV